MIKINNINLYTHKKYKNCNQRTNYSLVTKSNSQNDVVCFSAKNKPIKDLRDIPDITCACCGNDTIKAKSIETFVENKLLYSGEEAIDIIKKAGYFNKKTSTKSELLALKFCETCAKLYQGQKMNVILAKDFIEDKIKTFDKETQKNIKKIENMSLSIYHDSEYMVSALKKYENQMHKAEKEVFQLLERESKLTPEKNFTEILTSPKIQESKIKKLKRNQQEIFNEIKDISELMNLQSQIKITQTIQDAKDIFDLPLSKAPHKRAMVIDLFENISKSIPEKAFMQVILEKIYDLPSSLNDANSFIIKYADLNPNEIAKKLLENSTRTIEHVIPKNRENKENIKNIKDINNIINYVIFCKKCNQDRARTKYNVLMKRKPFMQKHFQKYIDKVIEYINAGKMDPIYDRYPANLSRFVNQETETEKFFNFSKINITTAQSNRKKTNSK